MKTQTKVKPPQTVHVDKKTIKVIFRDVTGMSDVEVNEI